MERTFVPIETRVPSIVRVLQRDSLSRLLAVFFVLGLAASTIFVISRLRSRPSEESARPATPVYLRDTKPAAREPMGALWFVGGLALVCLLPLRIASIRRLFRRGEEVVGRVEHVGAPRRRVVAIKYRYTVDGRQYTGAHDSTLVLPLAVNASVQVIVDPNRPSRSILKHAYIVEAVDQVPAARVVT